MQTRDHFFRDAMDASAPLLLWALHFFVVYIFAALACESTLVGAQLFSYPLIEGVLRLLSLIASLLLLGLLWRAIALYRHASQKFLPFTRLLCVMLGTIGIVWTSVPMFILSACSG